MSDLDTCTTSLAPLRSSALLGLFQEVLDTRLVERGALQGIELLGPAESFWRQVRLVELKRMAAGGNPAAQAEMAWRCATGAAGLRDATEALRWASRSAESGCGAGEAALGWLLYHGVGAPRDYPEAARLLTLAAEKGERRGLDERRQGHRQQRRSRKGLTHS